MIDALNHRGYSAKVEYDPEEEILVGRVLGINDVVGFHAETARDVRAAFQEAVDDYLETCRIAGKDPDKAFSGKVMFRIDPDVHRRAALAAELSGKSLNEWAEVVMNVASAEALPRLLVSRETAGSAANQKPRARRSSAATPAR